MAYCTTHHHAEPTPPKVEADRRGDRPADVWIWWDHFGLALSPAEADALAAELVRAAAAGRALDAAAASDQQSEVK